jgi:hypothetical protein
LGPFGAPLGVVFPDEGADGLAESADERAILDSAGFELHAYSLRRRGQHDWEGGWRQLLRRAKAMGDEELRLRRDLNARYYVATMSAVRQRVQGALFEGAP